VEKCRILEENVASEGDFGSTEPQEQALLAPDKYSVATKASEYSDSTFSNLQLDDGPKDRSSMLDDVRLRNEELEAEVAELREICGSTKSTEVAMLTAEVESLRIRLQEQEEEATNAISQWEYSYQTLESELNDLKQRASSFVEPETFRELQDRLGILEGDTSLLRETNALLAFSKTQLEAQLADLKESLRVANETLSHTEDENDTNEELRKMRDDMEGLRHELTRLLAEKQEEITRLTNESQSLMAQKHELQGNMAAMERETSARISDLEKSVTRLRAEMVEHDEHANEAIIQAQERLSEANAMNRALETEKCQLEKNLESQAAENSARTEELEETVQNLQKELAEHDELANEAINQWQEKLPDAEARIQDLEAAKCSLRERVDDLEAKLATSKAEIEALRRGDDDAVKNLQARCKQLEDELSYLEDQAESYEGAIANRDKDLLELQRRIESSDDRISALTEDKNLLSSERDALKSDMESKSKKLADIDREHTAAVKELEGTYQEACTILRCVFGWSHL
jgi:chromosome segregation ATPase